MAKLAKRARLAPLAICRSPADTTGAWPEYAVSQSETAAADSAAQVDLASTNLRRAPLDRENFAGANLRGANLSGATLDHANCAGANLAEAELCEASLRFANLQAARFNAVDLSLADLRHARLDRADFSGASLSGALLDYADFSGANLLGADLSGSHLCYAKNLTKAQLDQARVDESTLLPFYLQNTATEPWIDTRRTARGRPIWIGMVLACAAAVLSLVGALFQFRDVLLPAQANVTVERAAAWTKVEPLRATIAVPDLQIRASEASYFVGATPTKLALLRPVLSAPISVAATSEAMTVAAAEMRSIHIAPRAAAAVVVPPLSGVETVSNPTDAPYRIALSTHGPPPLSEVPPRFVEAVTAIQVVLVRERAVEALVREAPTKPIIPVFPGFEPLTLIVSLQEQKIDVYQGTSLITSSKVSSGKRGYSTKAGVFSVLEKRRHHHSNLYSNAPMPWMQRLTWSGTALHGGVVPGYPASHGCVRLPFSFAPKLFQMTTVGTNVVVAGERVAPKPIEHAKLFQPVQRQSEIALATEDDAFLSNRSTKTPDHPGQAESTRQTEADALSEAALRILVTRRTERDQAISTQRLLASLGYLTPQNFTGRVGEETRGAIKAFQKAKGLSQTGRFTEELVRRVHEAAGKAPPPEGHLFVRQGFRPVFDVPIAFHQSKQPLGTHVFTLGLAPGRAKAEWTAVSLEGGDSNSVLNRIEIPQDVRQQISERLTPGSTFIVADTSVNSAILPDGDDFLVLAKVAPGIAALEPEQRATQKTVKPKRAKANAVTKPRVQATRKRTARPIHRGPDPYGGFRLFRRW